jgi:hypothetical protein
MTIDELIAHEYIRNTINSYTIAGDCMDAEKFSQAFTEDGVLDVGGLPDPHVHLLEGRKEIFNWFSSWCTKMEKRVAPKSGVDFVRHHLTTSSIELTGATTAKARTYWISCYGSDSVEGPEHCGHYIDVFNKVGDNWLIIHRILRADC